MIKKRGCEAFLFIDNLSFRYGQTIIPALNDFSLSMERGEVVGVAGQSGSGKSTLLRLIAGLERPMAGNIVIDGLVVSGAGSFIPPEKRRVGMVFQDYGLFPHLTVSGNISFGLHRFGRLERRHRTAEMLELIHMFDLARRYPYELSGGQQQRVALARALAPHPKLLLLDEPFSNLDAELRERIRGEVRDMISASGTTCLLVSHDQADLRAVCSRIVSH